MPFVLTPEQRRLRAQIAAYERWARETDKSATAIKGQAGLRAKYVREAREADPGITDAEAERRGECLWRAHLARAGLAASKAKAARKRAS